MRAAVQERLDHVDARNAALYDEEATKLDRWAEDLKLGLEAELKELDRSIREARRAARSAVALAEKLAAQRSVRDLERDRAGKRRSLYAAQDEVDAQRDTLIESIEKSLDGSHDIQQVYTVAWSVA